MKKLAFNLIIILCTFVLSNESLAEKKNDVEKSKKIAKNYDVSQQVKLDIRNSFGKVHVNTWDKNTISVDIEIIARMNSEERAQRLLDKIDIEINESSSVISFETKINKSMNNKNSEEFEINYMVNMPKKNVLNLKNSFGTTYLGESSADHTIKISYGDFKFENLTGNSNIKISFSDGSMRGVTSGEIEIKYSDVEIGTLGNVKMEQGFSDVVIDKAGTIDLESKYGDMEIGTVKGIKGYVGYSDFTIDRLEVELDMRASYSGGFTVREIANGFTNIYLDGKFGDITLYFEDNSNFTFETSNSFSDFRYSDLDIEFSNKIKEDFKSRYKGIVGNGKGGNVRVDSSYGDIKFR
jgi:hypothetical protein